MKSASHKEWMGVGDGHKLYILIMILIATVSYLDSLLLLLLLLLLLYWADSKLIMPRGKGEIQDCTIQ